MRRTARLFEIIQILRNRARPITAAEMAELLEVSTRTVYRDVAALQAMRTPIDGEAGIGYILRSGYDLPPLNFDTEEIEAIVVGLSLLARTGDFGLTRAAARVAQKIDELRDGHHHLQVSDWGASSGVVDLGELRRAIRDEQKLRVRYVAESDRQTQRTILPIAVVYYVEAIVLAAWCELRSDFRHFRVDRITLCEQLEARFSGQGETLRKAWQNLSARSSLPIA